MTRRITTLPSILRRSAAAACLLLCATTAVAQPMVDPVPPPVALPVPGPPLLPPGAFPAFAPAEPPQPESKDRVRLHLEDSSQLVGELPADAKLKLVSKLGPIVVPIKEVARIDVAEEKGQHVLTLANRDRVTGTLEVAALTLTTSFGPLSVKLERLTSLEAGKLYSQQVPVTRPSPDGRTAVTVYRTQHTFQPLFGAEGNQNPWSTATPQFYTVPPPMIAPTVRGP